MQKLICLFILISAIFCQLPLTKRQRARTANTAGNFTLSNVQDFEYFGVFTVGTPAQPGNNLILDTGSDQFWINAIGNQTYKPKKSSTANITRWPGQITYGSGAVSGYMGTEMLGQLDINLTNIKISTLFADTMQGMGNATDGLLGLGCEDSKNFVQLAADAKQLPDSLWGFDLRNQNQSSFFFAGSTSFPAGCSPTQLHWESVDWWLFRRWVFPVSKVEIDGKTLEENLEAKRALVDSGTSLLMMSPKGAEMLLANTLIQKNCQYSNQSEVYICQDCSAAYPSIFFTAGSGNKLVVVASDYMIQLQGEQAGKYCVLGAMADPDLGAQLPFMIFGDSFMRNYFVAYDKVNHKLGFSNPVNNGTTTEEYVRGFLE